MRAGQGAARALPHWGGGWGAGGRGAGGARGNLQHAYTSVCPPPHSPTHPRSRSQVSELFSGYVAGMLAEYAAAPATAWRSKDCAAYLVTALAVRSQTAAAGATATNQLVNLQASARRGLPAGGEVREHVWQSAQHLRPPRPPHPLPLPRRAGLFRAAGGARAAEWASHWVPHPQG